MSNQADIERALPHALMHEKSVLSVLLSDPAKINERHGLTEKSFYLPAHKIMFTVIQDIANNGAPEDVEIVTLVQRLTDDNNIENVGGYAAITELYSYAPTAAYFSAHCQVLHEKHSERLFILAGIAAQAIDEVEHDRLIEERENVKQNAIADSVGKIIQARAFDVHNRPPSPPPMVTLENNCLFTAGNLSAIIADRKAGKSSALTGILAALMAGTNHKDLLGFTASNPLGRAVVHFDTEQSPADHYDLVMRVLQRAGITEPPSWFSSYSLTGLSLPEKKQFITTALDYAARDNDGIQMVILDGIADICHDPNDAIESFDLVENWHNYAVNQDCVVLGVLHLNPGTDKSRGHLGSQLERKAETPLRIEKDGTTGVSTMYATHARHCHIARNHGYCFEYSKDHGMHITTTKEKRDEVKDTIKRNAAADKANEIMAGKPPMTHSDLVKAIMKKNNVLESQGKKTVKNWLRFEVIQKDKNEKYTL
jgi:replicative DNA helicase